MMMMMMLMMMMMMMTMIIMMQPDDDSVSCSAGSDGGTEFQLTSGSFLSTFGPVFLPQGEAGTDRITGVAYVTNGYAATARATTGAIVSVPTVSVR
jgi:hypothetical protein